MKQARQSAALSFRRRIATSSRLLPELCAQSVALPKLSRSRPRARCGRLPIPKRLRRGPEIPIFSVVNMRLIETAREAANLAVEASLG